MTKNYKYFKGDSDKKFNIKSMKKYLDEKQELDKKLLKQIRPLVYKKNIRILDACCGIGHLSYFINKLSPDSEIVGIDQSKYLIDEAKDMFSDIDNLHFKSGDIYKNLKGLKNFDITINWKTLSWLPHYEDMIKALFKITNKHIFISSLFYDGDIDFEIKVTEHKKQIGKTKHPRYYNVYSLPQFLEFVKKLGAKKINVTAFSINKKLAKPPIDQMGTYTETLRSGKKIQISGTIIMPWKIIHIEL